MTIFRVKSLGTTTYLVFWEVLEILVRFHKFNPFKKANFQKISKIPKILENLRKI